MLPIPPASKQTIQAPARQVPAGVNIRERAVANLSVLLSGVREVDMLAFDKLVDQMILVMQDKFKDYAKTRMELDL